MLFLQKKKELMIVFNTTYLVSPSVHDAWLQWITSFYIPDMLSTGCFSSPKLYKVLVEEKDGLNYSLQFSAPTVAKVKEWQDKYRDRQQTQLRETFGESVLFFSTYLKEVF
jgi:hypothetical protein